MTLDERLQSVLDKSPDFTGQVTIEVHVKNGEVKDVYVTERRKVHNER